MFSPEIFYKLNTILPARPIIIGERSLMYDIDDLVDLALPSMKLCIIDDVQTYSAFGNNVFNALKERFECEHITLVGDASGVVADGKTVEYIRNHSAKCDALIAVGGGTINDLCKYAAHLDEKPYIIFPTSASMNGYLSANASINIAGHKTTLPATFPVAVFCDFDVISNAPTRLSKSGLGDSLARPTAQADWLLSHLLFDTAYDETPFNLLADVEAELFDNAGGIAANDIKTIQLLMQLLLLSGMGMTLANGSYPASQGEHLIAHSHGMMRQHKNNDLTHTALHGEEIGITSLYMAKRQEQLLQSKPKLLSSVFEEERLRQVFGAELTNEFETDFAKKSALIKNKHIQNWDEIANQIQKVMLPTGKIESILKQAKSPIMLEEIGWTESDFITATQNARFTRDRFTFLDLEV